MLSAALPSNPRRIAFFLLDFSGGGIERVNLHLAAALAERYLVDLVVAQGSGEFSTAVNPALRVVELKRARAYQCLGPLTAYLKRNKPTVLFTCFPTLNVVALCANALAGLPTDIVPVEHMPVSVDRRENPSYLPRVAYALYPLLYRGVRTIGVNCEDAAQDFRREFPSLASRVKVLYNPVVSPAIANAATEALPPCEFLDSSPTIPVLVGAGRLTRQKDFPLLLRAFAAVLSSRPAKLIIVGGRGEDKAMLQALAADLGVSRQVLWTGFVSNPYPYFRRANLFVLSSLYETLPTVLIEALACGTTAVATSCFGVAEILDHGRLGSIIKDRDPLTLASAIVRALDNPTEESALLAQAKRFSIESAAGRYAALIEALDS